MGIILIKRQVLRFQGKHTLMAWRAPVLDLYMKALHGDLVKARMLARAWGALAYWDVTENLVVNTGKYLLGDLLIEQQGVGLNWHAIGTGSTSPALGDTTLQTEQHRKLAAVRSRTGNVCTFSVFYPASQCTYNLQEAGYFGGDDASSTPGSGDLFTRYLQAYDNSSGDYDLTYDYDLTVEPV